MKAIGENLLTVIVLFVLGVLAYVVIVGGVLCLIQDVYTFELYLNDLSALQPVMIGAIIGAVGRELTRAKRE